MFIQQLSLYQLLKATTSITDTVHNCICIESFSTMHQPVNRMCTNPGHCWSLEVASYRKARCIVLILSAIPKSDLLLVDNLKLKLSRTHTKWFERQKNRNKIKWHKCHCIGQPDEVSPFEISHSHNWTKNVTNPIVSTSSSSILFVMRIEPLQIGFIWPKCINVHKFENRILSERRTFKMDKTAIGQTLLNWISIQIIRLISSEYFFMHGRTIISKAILIDTHTHTHSGRHTQLSIVSRHFPLRANVCAFLNTYTMAKVSIRKWVKPIFDWSVLAILVSFSHSGSSTTTKNCSF